jgi:hypothetical protein
MFYCGDVGSEQGMLSGCAGFVLRRNCECRMMRG